MPSSGVFGGGISNGETKKREEKKKKEEEEVVEVEVEELCRRTGGDEEGVGAKLGILRCVVGRWE